eukprot:484987-Pyramimonas_sp.AAC.1
MRLRELTSKMIGGSSDVYVMKTKAAETGVLMRWATDFALEYRMVLKFGNELYEAGKSLIEYMNILRDHDKLIPGPKCKILMELCIRHLVLMDQSEQEFLPKSHLF